MTKDDFFSLKEGDTVRVVEQVSFLGPSIGTILYRCESWLDDEISLCFTFGDDFGFFLPSEVEEIKE